MIEPIGYHKELQIGSSAKALHRVYFFVVEKFIIKIQNFSKKIHKVIECSRNRNTCERKLVG